MLTLLLLRSGLMGSKRSLLMTMRSGGNLLGVLQKSAIRIEVSESDYDEAYRILTEFEDNIRSKG